MGQKPPMYIILNGASETGKSTLVARGLMERFYKLNTAYMPKNYPDYNDHGDHWFLNVIQDSFAAPMKNFIASTLGVKYSELKKNVMMGVLSGYTPREFLIDLSERYIKERYGDDAFGRWLEHRVLRLEPIPDVVIIDDGGFLPERSVLGIQARVIRVTRPGKTFEGDSRTYLSDPHYVLDNDGTVEQLEPKLDDLTDWIIGQLPMDRRPPMVSDIVEE